MSRNKHYAKDAKSRQMDQILDEEERQFEQSEEEFLTDDEIEDGFLEQPKPEKKEKPYYMPASKDEMHLGSYEYVWFSSR